MKNVSVIGIGKLGLCFALTLEKAGYRVLGVDVNSKYVDQINNKTFISVEPNVNEYLEKSNNFRATTSLEEAINFSDILFVLVATPSLSNGKYNHEALDSVAKQLMELPKPISKKQFIIGCTVMPKYTDELAKKLSFYNYDISYNPEFIAQGSIINDQLKPDMILIGEANKESGDIIEQIYRDMCINKPCIERMTPLSAEITKIALNCFLTTKISFANMIGDIAVQSGADYEVILRAIGNDSRIGAKYLKYGFGFGGPCFPRDNRALHIFSDEIGYDAKISKLVDPANQYHLDFQVKRFIETHKDKSSPIVMDSVTYKPNIDIIEESQQLLFAVNLAKSGFNVVIKETMRVIEKIKILYSNLFKYEEKI